MVDNVNSPSHYRSLPSGVETIDVTEHFNFNRGNAIKYIWRAGVKDPAKEIEDLQKAEYYIRREIKRMRDIRHQLQSHIQAPPYEAPHATPAKAYARKPDETLWPRFAPPEDTETPHREGSL